MFQGEQAEIVLHIIKTYNLSISWSHASFAWSNNAANNAGVICCIVGCVLKENVKSEKFIFENDFCRSVSNIGPYLVPMTDVVVSKRTRPLSKLNQMSYGSMSNDNGLFTIPLSEYYNVIASHPNSKNYIKNTVGGAEYIRGIIRKSLYIDENTFISEEEIRYFKAIFDGIHAYRESSNRAATKKLSNTPMFFAERRHEDKIKIFIPQVMSEKRDYLTVGLLHKDDLVIAPHMQIINGQLHEFSILSSKLHHVWISTVCGRLKNDIRYSNLLGWNTFPLPELTSKNKDDLKKCAEQIIVAREYHFPENIAELYNPLKMPENLRQAHATNDEVLERIYIGRKFKNDSERLERLIELYGKMSA